MTTIKERPILFSAPMARAILAGRKTMTRRVVKPQPAGKQRVVEGLAHVTVGMNPADDGAVWYVGDGVSRGTEVRCPYGSFGDRLWVRETWTPDHRDFYPHFPAVYKADAAYDYERNEKGEVYSPEQKSWYPYRWRPSIHMPRWASRITLQVEAVRVERLQDITEADAIAEGMHKFHGVAFYGYDPHGTPGDFVGDTAVEAFAKLWDKINGNGSWDVNPWVWVVSFSVVKP